MTPPLPSEYWATVGTILPVLALALVVEARSYASGWSLAIPRLGRVVRIVQTLLWILPLIAATFSEAEVLRALRGAAVALWVSPLCEATVLMSFMVLVFSPAVDLTVKAYPEPLARVLAGHPFTRTKVSRLRRSTERARQDVSHARLEAGDQGKHLLLMLDRIEEDLNARQSRGMPEEAVQRYRTQLADQRAWTQEQLEGQDKRWAAVEARATEISYQYSQYFDTLRRSFDIERRLLAELLTQEGLSGGVRHSPSAGSASKPVEHPKNGGDNSPLI